MNAISPPLFTSIMDEAYCLSPANALEVGKAAEYLVCVEAILNGWRAFPSDQGLPYDIVIDDAGKLLRVQVRSTVRARNISGRGRPPRLAYSFSVRRRGKGGLKRLTNDQCDLVALVALDVRTVAWMPVGQVGSTVQLVPAGAPRSGLQGRRLGSIDQFPLLTALTETFRRFEADRTPVTACKNGHAFTDANTGIDRGYRYCRLCQRDAARERRARQ